MYFIMQKYNNMKLSRLFFFITFQLTTNMKAIKFTVILSHPTDLRFNFSVSYKEMYVNDVNDPCFMCLILTVVRILLWISFDHFIWSDGCGLKGHECTHFCNLESKELWGCDVCKADFYLFFCNVFILKGHFSDSHDGHNRAGLDYINIMCSFL